MQQFTAYLMTVPNLLIVAGVWTLIQSVVKAAPGLLTHPVAARILPLVPILLCSAAVWIPGAVEGDPTIGSRIFLGIVLGALCGHAHKIFKQTALGQDTRINGR